MFFLQMGSVPQDDLRQVSGGRRGINGPPETLPDQKWQAATVVKMGVGKKDGRYRSRIEPERFQVGREQFIFPLKSSPIPPE